MFHPRVFFVWVFFLGIAMGLAFRTPRPPDPPRVEVDQPDPAYLRDRDGREGLLSGGLGPVGLEARRLDRVERFGWPGIPHP